MRKATTNNPALPRGLPRGILVALLTLVSLNAVAAGYGFIRTPDGSALGIPQEWLQGTPFADYRIPGILLLLLGLLCGFAAYREVRRGPDAWLWAGVSGGAMIVWIVVQAALMGSFRQPAQTILQAAVLGIGIVTGILAFLQFRAWHLRWGATEDEFKSAMPGDEHFPKPGFNPTRAITIRAPPGSVWPWLVQMGYGRAGFYSYDLLDNFGKPSLTEIVPGLQAPKVGDWIPMSKKITEATAFRIDSLDPPHSMVWRKPDSTWAWRLTAFPGGSTRLVTRIRLNYGWRSPLVVVTLFLMEIGDFFMMRKCLRGIKQRAELTSGAKHVTSPAVAHSRPTLHGR